MLLKNKSPQHFRKNNPGWYLFCLAAIVVFMAYPSYGEENYSFNYTPSCGLTVSIDTQLILSTSCQVDTGVFTAIPSGNTGSVSYLWSTGATTASISVTAAGTYSVLVMDSIGCTASDDTAFSQPDTIELTLASDTFPNGKNLSGCGSRDGSISLVISGGRSPFTYTWSDGHTVEDPDDMDAGTAFITVTDVRNCKRAGAIYLTEPLCTDTLGGLYAHGAKINLNPGANINVNGNVFIDSNAVITNNGTVKLTGNWVNHLVPDSTGEHLTDSGTVKLSGRGSQKITGARITTFYNLALEEGGVKILDTNAIVIGTLNLGHRELSVNNFKLNITNTDTGAIGRTYGFVSSDTGKFIRALDDTLAYLFPVGSAEGTPRYRPIVVIPFVADTQELAVRLENHNPTGDGYDINDKDTVIREVDSLYYHWIEHLSGSDSVRIRFYFDSREDAEFDGAARWWVDTLKWKDISSPTLTSDTSPDFSNVLVSVVLDSTDKAYALTIRELCDALLVRSDTTICYGSSVFLYASGGDNYQWTSEEVIPGCTTCDSIEVVPDDTTAYYVLVTDSQGCSLSDTVTVFVVGTGYSLQDTIPVYSVCGGDSATLTAPAGSTYSWSPAAGLSCTNCQSPKASPARSTAYTVVVTSSQGCISQKSFLVKVVPFASAGPDKVICAGDSALLRASGGSSYSWSPSTGLSCTNCATPYASPAQATTYVVTVTQDTCEATDTVIVYVIEDFTLTTTGIEIFPGEADTMTASATLDFGGTTPPSTPYFAPYLTVSYSWTPSATLSCISCPNPIANPLQTTIYTVTAYNAACSVAATDTAVVDSLFMVDFTPTSATNDTVTFTATISDNDYSYSWSINNVFQHTETGNDDTLVYVFPYPGLYDVCLKVSAVNAGETIENKVCHKVPVEFTPGCFE